MAATQSKLATKVDFLPWALTRRFASIAPRIIASPLVRKKTPIIVSFQFR